MLVLGILTPNAHNFLVNLHSEIRTVPTLIYVAIIFHDVLHKAEVASTLYHHNLHSHLMILN